MPKNVSSVALVAFALLSAAAVHAAKSAAAPSPPLCPVASPQPRRLGVRGWFSGPPPPEPPPADLAPALLILPGVRSIVSLIGIATIIAAVWYTDRAWDERGSAAYKRAKPDGVNERDVVIPREELDAAFPYPWAFILGWVIFGVACLFPPGDAVAPAAGASNLAALAFSLALGWIASVPMGEAVRTRNHSFKLHLGMAFVLCWIGLSVSLGLDAQLALRNRGLALGLCLVGAFMIIASMKILWKFRKMGDSWEQEGRPNPNPMVYNMGGPLFVFGWFLVWVGMCAADACGDMLSRVDCSQGGCGLPVYFNLRSALAFYAGVGMVPVVMMLDYAHDEGAEFTGFGTDGRFFGRFLESPIPFLMMWTFLGLTGFIAGDNTFDVSPGPRAYVILVNCIAQGVDAGVLIQTALYEHDMSRKNKWSVPFLLMFIHLGVTLGLRVDYSGLNYGGLALALSLPGAMLVVAGQITIFGDRKRGDYWMQHNGQEVNPNPVVYSPGEILFTTGWVLLSLAFSLFEH